MGEVDFGRTAEDCARHRAGFPAAFFERAVRLGVGLPGQALLDLGTGTGTLARGFAVRGARVVAIEPAAGLLERARDLDRAAGVSVEYHVARAEATGLPDGAFDAVTAGQCWHWFDRPRAAAEAGRVLRPGGALMIAHLDSLAYPGNVVEATEALIEAFNPTWRMGGGTGIYPAWFGDLVAAGFRGLESFSFDLLVPYSHEAWRGRVRASAGVGASLPAEAVARFDEELARVLAARFPETPPAGAPPGVRRDRAKPQAAAEPACRDTIAPRRGRPWRSRRRGSVWRTDRMGRTLEEGLRARFSHVANFTGYMRRVHELLAQEPPGLRILDVPAGNGLLADALEAAGHTVVRADINEERRDFVYANLEDRLPFQDASFDVVICLEGVEHLLQQTDCLRELVRVARPGGRVVVSTPNIQNFYSRVTFLLRGVFFQFSPAILKRVQPGELADRGHIAPIGIYEMAYLMATFGARLERTLGDHVKKKVLLPVFLLLLPLMALVTYPMLRRLPGFLLADGKRPGPLFMNRYALLSRSLICVFRKD